MRALADQLHLNYHTLRNWEVGRTRVPADRLPELAHALRVSVQQFYEPALPADQHTADGENALAHEIKLAALSEEEIAAVRSFLRYLLQQRTPRNG